MKAIISICKNGNELALKLADKLPDVCCYTLPKWEDDRFLSVKDKLKDFCAVLFEQYDSLIFIMASGIVVRSIAPWIKDKTTDPAVIVMDEKGQNVISLLSGHLGGANELCLQIAHLIKSNPVITTASDVNQLPSVDMMAKSKGFIIDNMHNAKVITAMMVNGLNVRLVDEDGYFENDFLPTIKGDLKGEIIVSNKSDITRDIPYAQLIPQNIYLGIGCKKDTDSQMLIDFVFQSLIELKLDFRSVCSISSIDVKINEQAIQEASKKLRCKLKFYSAEELQQVDHLFEGSEFVKSTVGVASVSSTSAYLSGNKSGSFLLEKKKKNGMTLSVFKKKMN